ncbi:alpha/beta fold hydrolase [Flavobacterium degerlachei]|jgi:pimeloyl-ACP methyl ester carboxylesterase|uniref:Pimeloyl-ACP methyl ester carboxylesterase n=1 Tax=Flavobacterium degerlachei TaxID=229203 RepID=A0A1H2Y8S7_9FLAO|nr:alpha/beta hydrolase [Flavobacterium degerlachei]SDX01218.1 Pimeloyl-ACP methyl ester carboxylesterase [Flavobacterium degerlachei]
MPKIMVNSLEINYEDIGLGETLVLLHGLGSTIKDWDFQIPVLSEKFRLIIPDFRGHGKSGINNDDFGVEFLTEDIFQLLQKLEIEKASFVGFSMGGAVSFQMAVSHPEIVDKLIIVNSGPDFDNMGKMGTELLKSRTAFLKTKGLQELAKEISKNMFPEPHQQKLRLEFEERCGKNNSEVYYKTFVTLMEWGLGDKLETIPHKTLVVGSDMDYMPVSYKEEYASRMQNASLAIVSNSRHGVVMDQHEVFNKIILNFLENE